jgi:hypothetical protein
MLLCVFMNLRVLRVCERVRDELMGIMCTGLFPTDMCICVCMYGCVCERLL